MDGWKKVRLERESSIATTRQAAEETEATLGDAAVRIAIWLLKVVYLPLQQQMILTLITTF